MKLLLIDDDPDQLAIRTMLLEQHGFSTKASEDPTSALANIEAESPDCIVLDLSLPDPESGLMLLRTLRNRYPQMPVLVLTGYPAGNSAVREAGLYANAVLGKGDGVGRLLEGLQALC